MSYHDNGEKEYEGYWCDDNRCGKGKVYDRYGKLIKECVWYNGNEIDIDIEYEENGSKPINIGIEHLKLNNNCILKDWDVSLFENLESIEIGNDCFESVKTIFFLSQILSTIIVSVFLLKTLKILIQIQKGCARFLGFYIIFR